MKYLIEYQDVPYCHSSARTLLIEADSERQAALTAFHTLTQRGYGVYVFICIVDKQLVPDAHGGSVSFGQKVDFDGEENIAWFRAQGLPEVTNGRTHIRSITPYTIQPTGTVLEG